MAAGTDGEPTLADIHRALLGIARNTAGIELAIQKLGAGLRLPDREAFAPTYFDQEMWKHLGLTAPKTTCQAFKAVRALDHHLRNIELHLSALRAQMGDLLDDAGAMKNWREWQGVKPRR